MAVRQLTADQIARWETRDYTGTNRAMQRATLQVIAIQVEQGIRWNYADYLFGQRHVPKELPNVRSIHYERHIDTDVATMTMTLYNTEPLALGTAVTPDDEGNYVYDKPGWFTFNRGVTTGNRWHHSTNSWQGMLAPDRLIRTYEGYGFDPLSIPENDPHMVQSGVWLIDTVDYEAVTGLITVECRDAGRILLDCTLFPPIVPLSRYPLSYTADYQVTDPPKTVTATGLKNLSYDTDSGVPYYGSNGAIYGHHPSDAFDTDPNSYWLSVGNAHPRADYAFEYVQGQLAASSVRHVRLRVWGGPYVCYISVYSDGAWKGTAKVPYNPNAAPSSPNGANIPYVKRFTVAASNDIQDFDLGATYANVTKVRVCFTSLTNSRLGPYPYRAGVRIFQVATSMTKTTPSTTHTVGDFGDYSDIVKQLLAWSGWHWPQLGQLAFTTQTDGTIVRNPCNLIGHDPAIGYAGEGRVWGDIETAGTGGIPGSVLGVDIWDKKPVMDGVAYVRDVLGYLFFIDETGAAVFRLPNVWKHGNFVGDNASGPAYVEGDGVVIDENESLVSLSVGLTSTSLKDRVFVANATGSGIGAVSRGRFGKQGPFDANMRRVGGWTDMNFTSNAECQRMADLITIRQLISYRTDKVRIPGYSAVQIDDQARIIEGTTSETFVHYVAGVTSDWNIESGEWWYDLETSWLGSDPSTDWAFTTATLDPDTVTYLTAIGRI
jgi:hypothetical protein